MKMRAFGRIKGIIKKKKKVFLVGVLAVVLTLVFLFQGMGSGVEVETALAVRGDIKRVVEQTGEIEAAKNRIYTRFTGAV